MVSYCSVVQTVQWKRNCSTLKLVVLSYVLIVGCLSDSRGGKPRADPTYIRGDSRRRRSGTPISRAAWMSGRASWLTRAVPVWGWLVRRHRMPIGLCPSVVRWSGGRALRSIVGPSARQWAHRSRSTECRTFTASPNIWPPWTYLTSTLKANIWH